MNEAIMSSRIHFLGEYNKAELYLMRDDLIPLYLGGNKARIAEEFFHDMNEKGRDSVVSYGSPASNLNRAVAQMAEKRGIPCTVICKEEEPHPLKNNEKILSVTSARRVSCRGTEVRETVERVMESELALGRKPYYVYGNSSGRGNEATAARAYERAFLEIKKFENENGIFFNHIFLSSGTGMTQGGLIAGMLRTEGAGSMRKITGISVARDECRGRKAIAETVLAACADEHMGRTRFPSDAELEACIDFNTAYLCGGYGRYSAEIAHTADMMMARYGIALDPCYTAKGFYGMLRETERLGPAGKILFIHTGGTAGYFDYLAGKGFAERM